MAARKSASKPMVWAVRGLSSARPSTENREIFLFWLEGSQSIEAAATAEVRARISADRDLDDELARVRTERERERARREDAERLLTEAALGARTGRWVYLGVNAEFLFFPFCEGRRIGDLTTFLGEERRDAAAGVIVHLAARPLQTGPGGRRLAQPARPAGPSRCPPCAAQDR